jgi:adenosylcobinamide-GDP ribazoletransferase
MKRAARGICLNNRDIRLIDARDLAAALGLLTRLPVPVDGEKAMARGAGAAWAYPEAGAVVGAILAAFVALATAAGLPAGIVAGLVLVIAVIVTGAMHEDGLADSADGLWGGWDKARRLEIMKDSHIGVYGVIAIGVSLLLRWTALLVVIAAGAHWTVLIAVACLSRVNMVVLMALLPNARDGGLSKSVGRPAPGTAWVAVGVAAVVAILCGWTWMMPVAAATAVACALIARAKIGGQTGDILGATQQVTEIALLITAVAVLT